MLRARILHAIVVVSVVALSVCAAGRAPRLGPPTPFTWDVLVERARDLSAQEYRQPASFTLPSDAQITYDEHRAIVYRPRLAVWRRQGLPFQVLFPPCGYAYPTPVHVWLLQGDSAREVLHELDLYEYPSPDVARKAAMTPGFAGLAVLHPINRPDNFDEVLHFLGASYFRAVGRGGVFGASARGLAVDIGLPTPEEFPRFGEFWVRRPCKRDATLEIYALMDSPSLAGAYRFELRPGDPTTIAVEAKVFLRRTGVKLGIAPITSMFLYGESGAPPALEQAGRPEVHDSDGLLAALDADEWLWRPLVNPNAARVSSFAAKQLRVFGLMQRDREESHYRDLRVRMERRPSVWVEPADPWQGGEVHLLEFPAAHEGDDNIGAFWAWDKSVDANQELTLRYRVHFGMHGPRSQNTATVSETWRELWTR